MAPVSIFRGPALSTRRHQVIASLCAVAAIAAGVTFYPRTKAAAQAPKKAQLVTIVATRTAAMPIDLDAQGHVVPLNFVDVRPQLAGTVVAIHFHEGDDVKAGQLLFTLDDSDARTQLAKAQAQGALIDAQLADARRELQRQQTLVAAKFVATSVADTASSKVDALLAQDRAAVADANSARILVGHTRIVSPIAGKAGAVSVHRGSLAQLNATLPLVTVSQFAPIGVEFTLPEQALAAVLAARAAGPVSVTTADGKETGQLVFIDNTIHADSATISLKASFPNAHQTLWPGGFARIVVHAGTSASAVVLPPQAVQEGPSGRFVFALNADGTVRQQAVTLLRVQDGSAVIAGLADGVKVVQEGGQNLRAGMAVQVAGTP